MSFSEFLSMHPEPNRDRDIITSSGNVIFLEPSARTLAKAKKARSNVAHALKRDDDSLRLAIEESNILAKANDIRNQTEDTQSFPTDTLAQPAPLPFFH